MANYKGIGYLRNKLAVKRNRVLLRYRYYDMKEEKWTASPVIPKRLKKHFASCLGWCAKGVDTLSCRLVFNGFDNDDVGVNDIFALNNPGTFFRSSILGALIASCSFVYISEEDGEVRLQVIDGSDATGVINPVTGLLDEGYAVLMRDDRKNPLIEAYFTKEATEIIYSVSGAKESEIWSNPTGYPLLVPVIFRPDATRYFGHSRISRACMNLQGKALQTLTRSDISAEFYSFPQKWVVGTDPEAEALDNWQAAISTMLEFSKDENGDRPSVGQFQAAPASPHIEQFKMYASAFAGETGLTLDDLGISSGNPASAEAIKASHENLRLVARDAQRTFVEGFRNVALLSTSLRDRTSYKRNVFCGLQGNWEPIFEPDASMLSSIGDGASKLNAAVPDYITKKTLESLTGIKAGD